MLSIGKVGPVNADYYQSTVVAGAEDYYADDGDAPGVWIGRCDLVGAVAGSLATAVDSTLLWEAKCAPDGTSLGKTTVTERSVTAFDLTFSAPKSGRGCMEGSAREGNRACGSLSRLMRQGEHRSVEETPAAHCTFADVYDAHVDEVYRFVHRRCREHALAEDITQEVFLTAIRSGRAPSSISVGWLITVARNRLIDVLRRQTNYQSKLRLVANSGGGSSEAELAERLRVEAALAELSVEHRLVLTLRYIDGFPVASLADHLDRSVKSIEGLLTRARRALRCQLDEAAASGHVDTGSGHG